VCGKIPPQLRHCCVENRVVFWRLFVFLLLYRCWRIGELFKSCLECIDIFSVLLFCLAKVVFFEYWVNLRDKVCIEHVCSCFIVLIYAVLYQVKCQRFHRRPCQHSVVIGRVVVLCLLYIRRYKKSFKSGLPFLPSWANVAIDMNIKRRKIRQWETIWSRHRLFAQALCWTNVGVY
jgi:hypothetical protein